MTTLYFDSPLSDAERRRRLYAGDVFVFGPRAASRGLASFAAEMLREAFAPDEPVTAQHSLPVERFVELFAPAKPRFIHHPTTRRLVEEMAAELGCDADGTYLDVPRLRGVTSDGYLTSGVGYAHHPHRDTWYSAPMAQINWWIPIFEFASESSLALLPKYNARAVANSSREFNYYEWNAVGRQSASAHVKSDTRKQPRPLEEIDLSDQLRIVCEPGGVVLFSGAMLHATVPNTSGRTRFSLDLRTVDVGDLASGVGAVNVDSHPEGTSLRDFRRGRDGAQMPDALVRRYENVAPSPHQCAVFTPDPPPPSGSRAA